MVAMSKVTKIHTVDGYTLTFVGDCIAELNCKRSFSKYLDFGGDMLLNLDNVTYMEVVDDENY